jgi:hypothetical protein
VPSSSMTKSVYMAEQLWVPFRCAHSGSSASVGLCQITPSEENACSPWLVYLLRPLW